MSLEAILAAIEAAGEIEVAQLRIDTESRAQQIRAEAERQAATVREDARHTALLPSSGERARRLHQAKLEALHTIGEVRTQLVEAVLAETRQRLICVRADSNYRSILRRLIEEVVDALGDAELHNRCAVLEIDPRDETHVHWFLDELGVQLQVIPSLNCWGGVVIKSGDERVVVTNTLESRLERAIPVLRQDVIAFVEKELTAVDV